MTPVQWLLVRAIWTFSQALLALKFPDQHFPSDSLAKLRDDCFAQMKREARGVDPENLPGPYTRTNP